MPFSLQAMLLVGATCYLLTAILFLLVKKVSQVNNCIEWWILAASAAAISCIMLLTFGLLGDPETGEAAYNVSLIAWAIFLHIGGRKYLSLPVKTLYLLLSASMAQAILIYFYFIYPTHIITSLLITFYCSIANFHFAYCYRRKKPHKLTLMQWAFISTLVISGVHWLSYPIRNTTEHFNLISLFFTVASSIIINLFLVIFILNRFKNTLLRSEYFAISSAMQDQLTGLSNRMGLEEQFKLASDYTKKNNTSMLLLFIDLDKFKPINDQHGHCVGDQVLIQIAQRLKSMVRSSDIIARIGGDEFIIVLTNFKRADIESLSSFIHHLLKTIQHPIDVRGQQHYVNMSLGVARYPEQSQHLSELLNIADQAMYLDKTAKKNKSHYTVNVSLFPNNIDNSIEYKPEHA